MKRFLIALILGGIIIPSSLFAEKEATPAYLLTIFIGFGSGHGYAESPKWSSFCLAEVGSLVIYAVGTGMYANAITSVKYYSSTSISDASSKAATGALVMGMGAIALSVSRVWEIVDIFGTVEKQKKLGILTSFDPSIEIGKNGVAIAAKYSY